MSIYTFYNCIVAAAVACVFSSLLDGAKPQRAAGVLVLLYGLNKRFKAVLRAFKCLGHKYTLITQKAVFEACGHVITIHNKLLTIQATPKTHAHDAPTVSRCPKPETRTRPKSGKNVIFP